MELQSILTYVSKLKQEEQALKQSIFAIYYFMTSFSDDPVTPNTRSAPLVLNLNPLFTKAETGKKPMAIFL